MSALRILKATPDHLDQIVPLFLAYCEFYGVRMPATKARRFLRERLTRGESRIFLARLNGVPVGFMQMYPTFATLALKRAWILYDLFVAPTARRHGVATALLERAARLGAATGAAELVLETARTNRQAQRLYESMGWRRDDKFLVYRRLCQPRK